LIHACRRRLSTPSSIKACGGISWQSWFCRRQKEAAPRSLLVRGAFEKIRHVLGHPAFFRAMLEGCEARSTSYPTGALPRSLIRNSRFAISGKWTMYFSLLQAWNIPAHPARSGAPQSCRQGTTCFRPCRSRKDGAPMRAMMASLPRVGRVGKLDAICALGIRWGPSRRGARTWCGRASSTLLRPVSAKTARVRSRPASRRPERTRVRPGWPRAPGRASPGALHRTSAGASAGAGAFLDELERPARSLTRTVAVPRPGQAAGESARVELAGPPSVDRAAAAGRGYGRGRLRRSCGRASSSARS